MTKTKHAANDETPLTAQVVQRMINASIIRFEMLHGHLSEADGAAALAELEQADDKTDDDGKDKH